MIYGNNMTPFFTSLFSDGYYDIIRLLGERFPTTSKKLVIQPQKSSETLDETWRNLGRPAWQS